MYGTFHFLAKFTQNKTGKIDSSTSKELLIVKQDVRLKICVTIGRCILLEFANR